MNGSQALVLCILKKAFSASAGGQTFCLHHWSRFCLFVSCFPASIFKVDFHLITTLRNWKVQSLRVFADSLKSREINFTGSWYKKKVLEWFISSCSSEIRGELWRYEWLDNHFLCCSAYLVYNFQTMWHRWNLHAYEVKVVPFIQLRLNVLGFDIKRVH